MKQLSVFNNLEKHSHWNLYIDGASRNNPGESGVGIFILKNDKKFLEHSFYLGIKTNNQAEYLALLLGLTLLKSYLNPEDRIEIISDSELLIKQINGQYAVKNHELKKLYQDVKHLLLNLNYKAIHVLRQNNKVADKLANKAIDEKIPATIELKNMWCKYEI